MPPARLAADPFGDQHPEHLDQADPEGEQDVDQQGPATGQRVGLLGSIRKR